VIERRIQELPLVGRIAAGRPLEAVEERETISLGDFCAGRNSFVLQVKGNSMIEDHIMDGILWCASRPRWRTQGTSWWHWCGR